MVVRVLGAAKHDRGQVACGGEGEWGRGASRGIVIGRVKTGGKCAAKRTAYRDERDGRAPPQRSS